MDKIKELKARAYDLIALIQQAQIDLTKVNEEVARLSQELEVKETPKK